MSTKHDEQLKEILAQKDVRAELEKRLGEGFMTRVRELDAAETNLASFVDSRSGDSDTQQLLLQFLSCYYAAKAGLYGAGVCIGWDVSPPAAFEVIQNRVLAGFHASLLKHREVCTNPACEAAMPMDQFLAGIAHLVNQMQTAGFMQRVQRDANGKPVLN
jgi:hypothetical protein